MNRVVKIRLTLLFIFVNFLWVGTPQPLFAVQGTIDITATVPNLCGNGVIDQGEECDGSNFAGQTCASRGFSGGFLSCNANCTFNTSQCTSAPPPSGGGGGAYIPPPVVTEVIFTGRAYPKSTVTLLKDAQIAATTIAGADANFQISISGLSGGNYIFSLHSEDREGRRSSLLIFPVSVTSGATIEIGSIFIAPTIAVDKSEVKRGDNIAIFGQSVPNGEITVAISSEEKFFGKTAADQNGAYLYNFDTAQIEKGQHLTKSKAAVGGAISSFGKTVSFIVGAKTVFAQPSKCPAKADLNNDCRVNLVDFSIAAYWYKRSISAEFAVKEKERLSGDGKVDLVDFSIMAFYWTG